MRKKPKGDDIYVVTTTKSVANETQTIIEVNFGLRALNFKQEYFNTGYCSTLDYEPSNGKMHCSLLAMVRKHGVYMVVVSCLVVCATGVQIHITDNQCNLWTFEPRPVFDNLVSSEDVLTEISGVAVRAECFAWCLATPFCNLVLYKPDTSTCRLYSDAFPTSSSGIAEAGWQYIGVPCDQYRLKNLRIGSQVLTSAPSAMCADGYEMSTKCPGPGSSCYDGSTWAAVDFKCVPPSTPSSLPPNPVMDVAQRYTLNLFQFYVGLRFTFDTSGSPTADNIVTLEKSNGDMLISLTVKFSSGATIADSKKNGAFLQEVRVSQVPATTNYMLDIYLYTTEIKVYADGAFMLSSPVHFSMTGTTIVSMQGFTSLQQFEMAPFSDEDC